MDFAPITASEVLSTSSFDADIVFRATFTALVGPDMKARLRSRYDDVEPADNSACHWGVRPAWVLPNHLLCDSTNIFLNARPRCCIRSSIGRAKRNCRAR